MRTIRLDSNADIITAHDLVNYLLDRLEDMIPEYNAMDDNDYDKHYVGGLIAGFETVLISVGYDVSQLPEHDEVM